MKEYLIRLKKGIEGNDIWSTIIAIKPYTIKLEIVSVIFPIMLIRLIDENDLVYIRQLSMVDTVEEDGIFSFL